MNTRERILGCLLGGAIGDALGAGIEFDSIGEIRRRHGPVGITGYVPAYGRIGAITDDTQMTLFTAEGLIRAKRRLIEKGIAHAPEMVHLSYRRWLITQGVERFRDQTEKELVCSGWLIEERGLHVRRAPGNTCLSALMTGRMGTPDEPLNDSKGCGGVMRGAPVAFTDTDVFTLGAEVAAITHGHPSGYLSAGALALLIQLVASGMSLDASLDRALDELRTRDGAAETIAALNRAIDLAERGVPEPEQIEDLGGGWVGEEALAIAVACVLATSDVRTALLAAVNHSGDSDSTGAIAGNLLGALYSVDALPADLLAELELRDVIQQVAEDLADEFVDAKPVDGERYPPW